MAESAAALARTGQKIHIPRIDAACPMADMAPASRVEDVLNALRQDGRLVIPLTYVNSSAEVKAVCGLYGGSVCTSSNAKVMLEWALQQGDAVLFLPDKNLGHNTANQLNIDPAERLEIDIRQEGQRLDHKKAQYARLLLWPGACAIHHQFKKSQIQELRRTRPGVRVIVHPECPQGVVRAADGAGSTSYLIKYCATAPAGAKIAVATECNLVNRLTARHKPEGKDIFPLKALACSNMAKVSEERLLALLETLDTATPVRLSADVAEHSRVALERMLRICS
jgi:quinolinate synthase